MNHNYTVLTFVVIPVHVLQQGLPQLGIPPVPSAAEAPRVYTETRWGRGERNSQEGNGLYPTWQNLLTFTLKPMHTAQLQLTPAVPLVLIQTTLTKCLEFTL